MNHSKSKTLSFRLTSSENDVIRARAEEAGVSISRYMVNAATADKGLSLTAKQQIYEHKTIIKDLTKQLSLKYNDSGVDKITKEVDAIWKLLK